MLVATKPLFEELVDVHSGELFGYLWRLLGDEQEAQDCLQDTFLRAYRAYGRVENGNLRAWLYKIATNRARTSATRTSKLEKLELSDQMAGSNKSVELQVVERISLAAVRAAVAKLPVRQRAALMMRKYLQLEYAEIADALDCTEAAARANVYQALKKLRKNFNEDENE